MFYGVPLALPFAAPLLGGAAPMLQYVSFAVVLWALVELGLIRGTIGVNPHGPDPVAPKPAPARMAH